MYVIVLILAAMAVGLGGLFLLAKAQKENLGKLYSTSAYVIITISTLVILFSITAGIMHCCHHNKGGNCCKGKSEMSCHKGGDKCGSKGSCNMDASCGATMSDCSGGSCSKGGMKKCGKSGDCMMMSHCGKKMTKKIIRNTEGDSANVEVKIIAE